MRSSRSSSISSFTSKSDSEETIHIFVRLLNGETIPLNLPSSTTLTTLQQLLSLRTSLPVSSLRLTHAGRHLFPTSSSSPNKDTIPTTAPASPTLSSLNLPPDTLLTLSIPIRGGMPPKKIRCTFKECKDPAQRIIGDCGFCSGHFCAKHRMLEDHKCTGLEDCKKESHERNAVKLNSERTMVVKGI